MTDIKTRQPDDESLWRFWNEKAQALAVKNTALEARIEELEGALKPFAHIGGSEALTESLPPSKGIIARDGERRLFAIDWSCFLAASRTLSKGTGQ